MALATLFSVVDRLKGVCENIHANHVAEYGTVVAVESKTRPNTEGWNRKRSSLFGKHEGKGRRHASTALRSKLAVTCGDDSTEDVTLLALTPGTAGRSECKLGTGPYLVASAHRPHVHCRA